MEIISSQVFFTKAEERQKKNVISVTVFHVVKKAKIALKWTVARENRIHAGPRFEFKWQFRKLGGL